MKNFLLDRVDKTPTALALEFENQTWTFEQLHIEAHQYAGKIAGLGIYEGSKVGLIPNNTPESVFVFHALMLLGTEVVLLNSRLTDAELNWQVENACVRTIFTCEYRDLENSVALTFGTLKKFETAQEFHIKDQVEGSEIATIMFTSGTTGNPKAVKQTYGNHFYSAVSSSENLKLDETDKWLCVLPLYHIGGLSILLRSVIVGMSVKLEEKFNAKNVNAVIKTDGVTIASVISTMLSRMLAENLEVPTNFKGMLLGGGPAPVSLLEICESEGISVFQTYGMTETCSQFTTLAPEDTLRKLGSAGKPLGKNEIRIAAPNEGAEIFVRGPVVTPGYLNEDIVFQDGWFATGDYGYLDDEGYLFIQDRRSDLIISGGENIYPAEVESVLLSHDNVIEAGVIGISSEKWGSVPVAFVVTNSETTELDLKKHCQKHLAKYKIPTEIRFVNKLPRTANGKLLRRELRK